MTQSSPSRLPQLAGVPVLWSLSFPFLKMGWWRPLQACWEGLAAGGPELSPIPSSQPSPSLAHTAGLSWEQESGCAAAPLRSSDRAFVSTEWVRC